MSKIKTIDMKKLINGLGINKGDIVVVATAHTLIAIIGEYGF